jgi:5-methylcytosine-specific restriction enzyme subunit McrC
MLTRSGKYVVYDCVERQPVDLPIDVVLASSGTLNIYPEVKSHGYFDVDYRGDKLTFVAGKYIGLIPINDAVCIQVQPKIAISNLVRLIAVANGDIGILSFFKRGYEEDANFSSTVIPLLLRTLLSQLELLQTDGVLKRYERREGEGVLQGRINFPKTLQRHWSRGKLASAAWDTYRFTKDNPPNRLIKYTLWYCGRLLDACSVSPEIRAGLDEVYSIFEEVPLDHELSFIPEVRHLILENGFPNARLYYYEICRTCLLIVGNHSVSLRPTGTDIDLLSFILNLEDLFERYIRNILKEHLSGASLYVLDGNREGRSYLFHDTRAMEVRPDIVIRWGTETALVADVKYKPKISEADRYQIISHAYSCGASKALFVLPAFSGGVEGLVRRGQVKDQGGLEIFEYHFRLDSDLQEQEAKLSVVVADLVGSNVT